MRWLGRREVHVAETERIHSAHPATKSIIIRLGALNERDSLPGDLKERKSPWLDELKMGAV